MFYLIDVIEKIKAALSTRIAKDLFSAGAVATYVLIFLWLMIQAFVKWA